MIDATDKGEAGSPQKVEPPEATSAYAWYVVAVLMLANISSYIDRQVMAFLVTPIKNDLRLTDTEISLLGGLAFAIFYGLLGFPIGRMADVRSRRAIIAWGIAIWSVTCALCGLARNYAQLFLARVGVGVGEAALLPPAFSLIADYFPPRRLASAMSVFGTGIFVGAGLAYLIGGTLIELVGQMEPWRLPVVGEIRPWQSIFIVVGLPGLILSLLMLTVREPRRTISSGVPGRSFPIPATIAHMRRHLGAYGGQGMGTAVFALVNFGIAFWFPAFFQRSLGWSAGTSGLYMGGATIVFGTLGVIAGGRTSGWLKRRGYEDANLRTAIIGCGMGIVGALPLFLSTNFVAVIVGLIITNISAAFPWGATAAAVQEMTPGPMRGQASALWLFLVNVIGLAVGPTVVALLTDYAYRDPALLGMSILTVTLLGRTLAAAIFARALRPFRLAISAAASWQPGR